MGNIERRLLREFQSEISKTPNTKKGV